MKPYAVFIPEGDEPYTVDFDDTLENREKAYIEARAVMWWRMEKHTREGAWVCNIRGPEETWYARKWLGCEKKRSLYSGRRLGAAFLERHRGPAPQIVYVEIFDPDNLAHQVVYAECLARR